MSLEFNKITEQVLKMGSMVEQLDFDLADRLRIALQRFASAGDVDAVREHVHWVRQSDMSGYRGAALLDRYDVPINMIYPPPASVPDRSLVIAADGSQIYLNEQAPVHYYLINIGLFVYHRGTDHLPEQITIPTLYFHKSHVHDDLGHVISNRTVDARRTVAEMQEMASLAWERRKSAPGSIIALYDNALMFSVNVNDVSDGATLQKDYHAAMQHLYDVQANGTPTMLAGYVDNPRGSVVLRLLHLLTLRNETEMKYKQKEIEEGGDLEGLRDRHLFNVVLEPGDRSAIMVQNSPRNLEYKQFNPAHEIAFFYIKVGAGDRSAIARVDIPAWVAYNAAAVDELHAILLAQSEMQGRNPYPYALTRADELAYVGGKDKAKLEELINLELRRKGLSPFFVAPKARGKELARSDRQGYELNTDLR